MSVLTLETSDHIATVTLRRPPVNAINNEALLEIRRVFSEIADDRDVRVVIFTAEGDRAFMGGADLEEVDVTEEGLCPNNQLDNGLIAREAMWAVLDCSVPVIGAINGPAIGAGVAFAACCDMLIASENTVFGTLEINVGLLGASAHLSSLVGRHKAREMYLLGERVPAEELHRLGVIRKVVPREKLESEACALAAQLADKSPIAMRLAKQSMNQVEGLPLKDAYRIEQTYTARLMTYEDSKEAREAYLEKRTPEWKWR